MSSQNLSNSVVEEDLFGDYSFSDMQNSFNTSTNENNIALVCQDLKVTFIEKLPNVSLYEIEKKIFKNELTKLRTIYNTVCITSDFYYYIRKQCFIFRFLHKLSM